MFSFPFPFLFPTQHCSVTLMGAHRPPAHFHAYRGPTEYSFHPVVPFWISLFEERLSDLNLRRFKHLFGVSLFQNQPPLFQRLQTGAKDFSCDLCFKNKHGGVIAKRNGFRRNRGKDFVFVIYKRHFFYYYRMVIFGSYFHAPFVIF